MKQTRPSTKNVVTKERIADLYHKQVSLAHDAEAQGDRVLSHACYQYAEYYLQLLKDLGDKPVLAKPSSEKPNHVTHANPKKTGTRVHYLRMGKKL